LGNIEVYIDDMLVKSLQEENHIADLLQVFGVLRRDNLRLNASKCTFGVGSGKFLGHVVSRRGIEANPDQIAALINLAEPRNVKQVQRLTGMIAALGRFISRSADKCKPFFRLLGKRSRFEWDEECSVAFQAIKAYLSTPPCLSIPNPGEPLFLYLAVSDHAVSAVLVRESTQEQRPVFFVSKTMDEAELRYLPLEKAALALLYAAKKLPHYFQSSTVTVLSDLPLKMLLQRSDFTGRITRWGVYLGSLGVEYKPRTAIKGQVLAEFLAEFQHDPSNLTLFSPAQTQFNSDEVEWKLFVDGASNSKGSGAGIALISPEGLVLEQAVRLKFSASNNEAEYEAMLIGLRTARKLGAGNLQIFCDSQLVANQISGEYQAKVDRMSAYLTVARTLLSEFDSTHVVQIGREHNSHADVLAKLATALESDMQRTVCIETLEQPSFQDQEVSVCSVNVRPSWMDPILGYIRENKLPEDKKEARMIKQKAPRFWVSKEGQLYRRSFTGPYLLCVHPDKVKDFLFEIHEGICGSHTGGRSLAHRALSQGYWWPYMQADALKYVQECDKCQRFAPMIHQPARELNPLSSPWPFAQWGLDIVGPLPRAPGNKKFLITATDYFTKWIEAEPLSNIRDVDTKRFLWKSIITRFGIPWAVISDNGTQFESKLFKAFCSDLGIRNFFSSPGYPQSNGQAEISNKVVLSGIKKKLEAAKGKWVEELPSILWAYRTTIRKSTNETPFALAFGVEAVIPLEIGMPTVRTTEFAIQTNEERLCKDLDLVEEKRDLAVVRLAAYQQQMKREHNKNVKPRTFQTGDLVLRKVMANTRKPNDGKLGPNWEGPYKVLSQTGHGAYRLEDLDGKPVPRPWNTCNLRKYFF
jgi:ribonuclease HI